MKSFIIPDRDIVEKEIQKSHKRSERLKLDQNTRSFHFKLTPEELEERRMLRKDFLDIARDQIKDLYRFVEGAGFAVTLADNEGYILEILGDRPILETMYHVNCIPGYRWSEQDVGTSAISLVLREHHPLQIHEEDHYFKSSQKYTCSAAPIYGYDKEFIGILALTGITIHVSEHTLGMVVTAAFAIQNQLSLLHASQEIEIQFNYLNETIDSLDNGVLLVDRQGMIRTVNQSATKFLEIEQDCVGSHLSILFPNDFIDEMYQKKNIPDKELFLDRHGKSLHLMFSLRAVTSKDGTEIGYIIAVNEIRRIHRIVNAIAGLRANFMFSDIVGESQPMKEAVNLAIVAAMNDSTVLLLGETGTGKELFAQAIHNRSTRKNMPFVAINCGAIPRDLLETELFGYSDGAFTGAKKGGRPGKFEIAAGGTLFLDEIGNLPIDMQVKLLRVLQTGTVCRVGDHNQIDIKVRVITATNANLQSEVRKGNFREDLFYRLNVFPIAIPPLRDRGQDVILIARDILNRRSMALRKQKSVFTAEAERLLLKHPWPGNVRELENIIERLLNMTDERTIDYSHMVKALPAISTYSELHRFEEGRTGLLEEIEKQVIKEVLENNSANISKSAQILGVTRSTLYTKIKKHNLNV